MWLSQGGTVSRQDPPAISPGPPGFQGSWQGAEHVFTGAVSAVQVTGKHGDSSSWTRRCGVRFRAIPGNGALT